jgi:hypothetical protein
MKKFFIAFVAVMSLIGLTSFTGVLAQDQPIGSGLSISPTRTDLVVNEGSSAELNISIKNVTGGNIIARAFINDFEPDGVTGEPRLITEEGVRSAASIRDFVIGLDDVPLGIDETKDIAMTVDIPAGASPGAYFGVIRYQAVPVDEEGNETTDPGQVALTASVGSIVLVEVPGDIRSQIEIKNLSAYVGDDRGTIFTKQPTHLGIEIENLGNGFARPLGKIRLENMFGSEIVNYEVNNTNPRGVVIPDSTRVFRDEVSGISTPGRYTISADISPTNGGEVYSVSSTFWYLPTWFLLVTLGVVIAIVGLAYYLYRKYTKTNKRR